MKTESINGIAIRLFNEMERRFLRQYHPEEFMFTSISEIKLVGLVLGVTYRQPIADKQTIRNGVVNYYSELMKAERDNAGQHTDKEFAYMEAMQSVTSVIDHYMYNHEN